MHRTRLTAAVPWAVFLLCLAGLGVCLHMNSSGALDDAHLTVYASILSIVLTTVVVVYCVVFRTEDSNDRYMRLHHPDETDEDGGRR